MTIDESYMDYERLGRDYESDHPETYFVEGFYGQMAGCMIDDSDIDEFLITEKDIRELPVEELKQLVKKMK